MCGSASPCASSRPTRRLRDRSPVAVSTRSPRPDRPMKVSARAPSATPRRVISARPRVISAARAFSPGRRGSPSLRRQAVDQAGGDGQHVLHRAADLDADRVGRAVDAQRLAVEGLHRGVAQRRVAAGGDQRRRLAARHLEREARARQHAGRAPAAAARARSRGRARRCRLRSPCTATAPAGPAGSAASRSRSAAIGVAMTSRPSRAWRSAASWSALMRSAGGSATSGR